MRPTRERHLKFELRRRTAGESVSSHWRRHRNCLVWICYLSGASQRLIACGFDLSRAEVRSIIRAFYRGGGCAQLRRTRKNISPCRFGLSDLRRPGK